MIDSARPLDSATSSATAATARLPILPAAPLPPAPALAATEDVSSTYEEMTFRFSEIVEAEQSKEELHDAKMHGHKLREEVAVSQIQRIVKLLAGEEAFYSLRSRAMSIAGAVAAGRLDVADQLLNVRGLPAEQRHAMLQMSLDALEAHLSPQALQALRERVDETLGSQAPGFKAMSDMMQGFVPPRAPTQDVQSLLMLKPNVRLVLEQASAAGAAHALRSLSDIELAMRDLDFHDRVAASAMHLIVSSLARSARTLVHQSLALLDEVGDQQASAHADTIVKLAKSTLELAGSSTAPSALERYLASLLANPARLCPWCARRRPHRCATCLQPILACSCEQRSPLCLCTQPRESARQVLHSHALRWPEAIWVSFDTRSAVLAALRSGRRRR